MVTADIRTLTVPVGIVRILEVVFTCISFSLVASVGHTTESFWTWSMFTWCFCFCVTLLILVLELIGLGAKLPISWDDFTTSFAMLSTLMVCVIFYFVGICVCLDFERKQVTCCSCGRQIGATVTSILAFILYATEVGLTRAKPGEISGFLSTVPGLLKVLEAFVACIIFICLGRLDYSGLPALQWCIAVYSICFIFAFLVIIFTIGRLLSLFPAPFDKVLTGCNVLAVLMYATAVVIWPLYSLGNTPRPSVCLRLCVWDNFVVISFMTCFNLVAYIVDTVYSFRLVFFTTST
ncbi:Myeloid-associated differentiation marker Protein SB135 [Channa argus]|uniref:Myeloid-associated differentiation marker Protein SB135 n=1 Tax=Channa argus TaxID=215402 RepID=A0A6G1QD77_CHAAH|nr:Myeloid-associated differentiation marker Protein SB135 [Channa argus]